MPPWLGEAFLPVLSRLGGEQQELSAADRVLLAEMGDEAFKETAARKPKSKKPLKGFMLFSKEMRPKVKAEDPDLTFGGIGKRLGELWRGLSDAEKAKYNK